MSQPNNNNNTSNGNRNPYSKENSRGLRAPPPQPNAWQQPPPPPQQQPPPQQPPPNMYARGPPQYVPYGMNPYAAYGAQQQQQQQQQRPPSMWQPAPPAYTTQTYYPPPPPQQQQQQAPKPTIPPKPRKVLTITDKDGNPIDLTGTKTKITPNSSNAAAADDAGAKMKQLALEKLKEDESKQNTATLENDATKEQETKRRQAEEEEAKKKQEAAQEEAKRRQAEEEEEEAKKQQAVAQRQAEEEQAKKQQDETAKPQEELPKRPSFLAKLQAKKQAAGITRGSSLSALQAKLDEKQTDAPPAPSSATASSSMQPPAAPTLRPTATTRTMAAVAATTSATTTTTTSTSGTATKRRVYTKSELLRFKESKVCCCRPDDLPDMTVERMAVPDGGGGGGRRGGGGGGGNRRESSWQRGAAPPRESTGTTRRISQVQPEPLKQQWARGVAPPPAPPPQKGGGRNQNNQGPPLYDGPIAPLTKSENRWRPQKDTNAIEAAEKQVKAILNKMTKETFDKLSTKMCDIPILSYDMLTMMIHNVYEKAIDEPTFGDMYADLCARLSQMTLTGTSFIQIIPSDEEPPTEDGEATTTSATGGESSSYKVYRWSNDVSTTDSEIVGPFGTVDECTQAALSGKDLEPVQRGDDLELELTSLQISNGIFIKTMKKKEEDDVFYVVYFPVAEHEDCGQQLSDIFLSEIECQSDANKQNSFKRSLLNKCQDEFDKQDIYVGWKDEKKTYEENKASMTDAERAEKEEELDFRRIKIKKQMLGNIKFIGQLYKKSLLKEKIMRYCIGSLLKLEPVDSKSAEYKDTGDMDLDDEDHEAACSMFTTIGKVIDKQKAQAFMNVCFAKMEKLSNDKSLNSRSRFMYKDLIELRDNYWEPRRETEKAKTITEIRKDFEREERRQEQQSRQMGGGGYRGGGGNRGDRRGDYNDRRDNRRDHGGGGGNRSRQPRPQAQVDDDGFATVVGRGGGRKAPATTPIRIAQRPSSKRASSPRKSPSRSPPRPAREPEPEPAVEKKDGPPALSDDKLKRRINTIRNEYVQDPNNIDELLLSVEEISGTPEYGSKLVSLNGDRIFEARDAERNAISEILAILVEKGKLTKPEVQEGLSELVEYIDTFYMDAPKAFEYLADVLSALFKVEALDVAWLCEQAEKTRIPDPDTTAPEKLVQKTMEAMKTKYGIEAVEKAFAGTDDSLKLAGLVGAEKWNAMTSDIMS